MSECSISSNRKHCLHPIYNKVCHPQAPRDQYSVTETICCHCGEKATLTITSQVIFHGKFAPNDPYTRIGHGYNNDR
jgi:hypothetical protein